MLKNYIKTAWRNLLKNKFYSLLNIAGLTAGLAIGILILLWVQDELSFDRFHKDADNIYRMELFGGTGSARQIFTVGVAPMGPLLKQQLPEVQDQVRITPVNDFSLYKYQDKVFGDERVPYVDPGFFTFFNFPLIQGNPAKPFADDNSVVITKTTASKFFGNENPIGKVIVADNKTNFTVTGVINDFPKNSDFNFDILMPISLHFKTMLAQKHDMSDNFDFYSYETYLKIKPGTDINHLEKTINKVHLSHRASDTDADYLLLPLTKMHLYNADLTDKGMSTVRIFIIVALLILVIACINYVNLSTARAMLRSKEISMRKIIGAAKTHLFMQFIIETALLFSIAAVLAVVLLYVLIPPFNNLAGKQLTFNLSDYHVWMVMLLAIFGTLAASSIYPALLLSSFEPLKALKGKISIGVGNVLFRKILVVVQFTFSVVLIIGTIVITGQLKYIHSKKLGYDKTNTFAVWMRDATPHYESIKAELLKQPGVLDVTRSNQNVVRFNGFTGDNDWDGKEPNTTFILHCLDVDKGFMSFFKMKLIEGEDFTGAVSDTAHFILNETAIKQMGIKNPIGKRLMVSGIKGKITGVVKDFHYGSMKEKILPAVLWYQPQYLNKLYVKTTTQDAQKALAAAEAQFKLYNGEYPFGYAFLDDIFDGLYKSEQQEGTLFNYFAAIAIMISCLGLLGLAAYTAQVRTREIGVRKVLGASVSRIVSMLAQDFIKLVFIAIIIAVPVAWYAMHSWLQGFAYRINMSVWIFITGGLIAVVIAFATISVQSIRAALTKPVKSLRSE